MGTAGSINGVCYHFGGHLQPKRQRFPPRAADRTDAFSTASGDSLEKHTEAASGPPEESHRENSHMSRWHSVVLRDTSLASCEEDKESQLELLPPSSSPPPIASEEPLQRSIATICSLGMTTATVSSVDTVHSGTALTRSALESAPLVQAAEHLRTAVGVYCEHQLRNGSREELHLSAEDRDALLLLLCAHTARPLPSCLDGLIDLDEKATRSLAPQRDTEHCGRNDGDANHSMSSTFAVTSSLTDAATTYLSSRGMCMDASSPEEEHSTSTRLSSLHRTSRPFALSLPHLVGADATLGSGEAQCSLSDIDACVASIRTRLTCWRCIVMDHLDAFTEEMAALLTAQHLEGGTLAFEGGALELARAMMGMVGQAVLASTDAREMVSTLPKMGVVHRRFNVTGHHFEVLHRVFMEVLPHHLDHAFGEEDAAAWEPFWKTTVCLLTHGLDTEREGWSAVPWRAEWMARARCTVLAVAQLSQMTADRGRFVSEMLECVGRTDNKEEVMLHLRSLREPPHAAALFEAMVAFASEAPLGSDCTPSIDACVAHGLTEVALRALRQPFIDICTRYRDACAQRKPLMPLPPQALGYFWDVFTQCRMDSFHGLCGSSLPHAPLQSSPHGAGPFCIMFTDIEAGAQLWQQDPITMTLALKAHHRIMRCAIADYGAYEVKTVGDSFVIAAKDVLIALKVALAVQLDLMRRPIAEGFEMPDGVQGSGPESCWRHDSLRVRMGIHYCSDASAVYDTVQRRYDYYGPGVNCAARTEAAAAGGQILMTRAAVRSLECPRSAPSPSAPVQRTPATALASSLPFPAPNEGVVRWMSDLVEFLWWGEHHFSGIGEPIGLFSVLPAALNQRRFPFFMGNRKVRVEVAEEESMSFRPRFHFPLPQLASGAYTEAERQMFRL